MTPLRSMCLLLGLAGVVLLARAEDTPPADPQSIEYTRLIPSRLPAPPVVPTLSGKGVATTTITYFLGKAGPWYNESTVRNALADAVAADYKEGTKLLGKSGQKGMLLKIQVVTQLTPGGQTFYSLRGDGVVLIGVGPDANSVCYFARCFNAVEPALPTGGLLAKESTYVWIEPANSRNVVSTYDIGAMEARAGALAADAIGAQQASSVARTAAIVSFIQAARAAATSERDRKLLSSLAQERAESQKQIAKIEEDLAAELRRQERIARTSATLNTIAAVLSFASTVANASISAGEDVTKAAPNGIKNKAELAQALNTLAGDSKAKIILLESNRLRFSNRMGSIESDITKIGIAVGLDPSASPILIKSP